MKTSHQQQCILIVEPDGQLREEIVNFLLSAGYQAVTAVANPSAALDKIRRSVYDIVVADAAKPVTASLQFATDLARLSPRTRVIFMLSAEDPQSLDRNSTPPLDIQFLIKYSYERNLLYLLEETEQP
jgi:DNA-binding NarL/FixJ family response regulator